MYYYVPTVSFKYNKLSTFSKLEGNQGEMVYSWLMLEKKKTIEITKKTTRKSIFWFAIAYIYLTSFCRLPLLIREDNTLLEIKLTKKIHTGKSGNKGTGGMWALPPATWCALSIIKRLTVCTDSCSVLSVWCEMEKFDLNSWLIYPQKCEETQKWKLHFSSYFCSLPRLAELMRRRRKQWKRWQRSN